MFTPGPWGHIWTDGAYVVDSKAGKTDVAKVVPRVNADEAEGNARLIAAAPLLLSACRVSADLLGDGVESVNLSELLKVLREAIAKAEGR